MIALLLNLCPDIDNYFARFKTGNDLFEKENFTVLIPVISSSVAIN